jgi:putative acetyltransferase
MIVTRRESPADVEGVTSLLLAAFADEGPLIVRLVEALRSHPCGRDGLGFVAEADDVIVGHVLVTRSRLDTFRETIDVAVLSPLAVEPSMQRRGIGSQLVGSAVEAATQAGLPLLFLEGDPAYYSRLGFRPGKPLGFRKPSIRIPDDAFQVVVLPGYDEWMAGTLVYAEPFWDLDCVGLRGPEFLAWLADEVAAGRQS